MFEIRWEIYQKSIRKCLFWELRIRSRFWPDFGSILAPFWDHFGRSWGPFASISAVLEPPEALPGGLLGRLGASWGASGPPNLNFDRFWTSLERSWSHFGAILDAQDLILDVQTSILEPQVPHLGGSDMILPHQASKPFQAFPSLSKSFQAFPNLSLPNLQASKPPRPRRESRSENNYII